MGRPLWIVAAMLVAGLVVINSAVRSDAVPPGQPGVIAFASDRGGDFDIYTVDPSTGTVGVLFDTSEDERYPAWSPDGTRIAFMQEQISPSPCSSAAPCWELWVREVASGTMTKIVAGSPDVQLQSPAWSPDGAQVAYTRQTTVTQDPKDLWVVDSTGGSPRRVTSSSVSEVSPDWSPDGTALVFSASGGLHTVSATAANGVPAPISLSLSGSAPVAAKEPTWSPDGRLAFAGGSSSFSITRLYSSSSSGTGTAMLWDAGSATLANPAWASDGSRIAFAIISSTGAKADLRTYDPCTGQATAIAASTADDLDPAWRPSLPAPSSLPASCPTSPPTTTPPPTTTTTTSTTTTSTTPPTTTTTTTPPTTTTTTTSTPPPTTTTTITTTTTTTTAPPSTSSTAPPPASTSSSPPPTPPLGTTITVSDLGFDPTPVRVRRGGTVIWENGGGSSHEVVDDTGLDLFGLPLEPAAFGTHTFISAGRYRYACAAHPALSGSVSVPITVSPVKGSRSRLDVTWASGSPPDSYAYDVQALRPGGRWRLWKDDVTRIGARFVADATGTYRFRARMVRIADAAHARWSVDDAIHVDL